jgi:hypothetical protein
MTDDFIEGIVPPDVFSSSQRLKARAVQSSGMGSAGLFTQRLVLIDVFETGQRLFAVKADIVRKGLNDLKKILDDMSIIAVVINMFSLYFCKVQIFLDKYAEKINI